MTYVTIYRAPNINVAWIMQDYFVTNDIDATISIDEQGVPEGEKRSTEDLYPFPSFILVPEDKAAQATELLKQFKLV